MTRKEAIRIIEKEIHIDVRCCTHEDACRFEDALRMAISALREQEERSKAESEGRVIVLPAKVDDPYFTIERICNCGGEEEIWTHHWGSDCEFCFVPCNAKKTAIEHRFANVQQILGCSRSIGKTVFLSREEAVRRLEEV